MIDIRPVTAQVKMLKALILLMLHVIQQFIRKNEMKHLCYTARCNSCNLKKLLARWTAPLSKSWYFSKLRTYRIPCKNQRSAIIQRPCPPCGDNILKRIILQLSHNPSSRISRTNLRNFGTPINTEFCRKSANFQHCADNPTLHLNLQ